MKKDLRTVLVAMLLIALSLNSLFAAGGAEAKPQETKTINFWYWDQNGEEVYKKMIKKV